VTRRFGLRCEAEVSERVLAVGVEDEPDHEGLRRAGMYLHEGW
jgi:hypothetical protein